MNIVLVYAHSTLLWFQKAAYDLMNSRRRHIPIQADSIPSRAKELLLLQ